MSIILTKTLVEALANEVNNKGQIYFFNDIPSFEELVKLDPRNVIVWMTTHGRPQRLIIMEDDSNFVNLISKDIEGGDIWSLYLPKEIPEKGKGCVMFVDVIHDFRNNEEDEYGYACDADEPSPEEAAAALAERYGVSQEDDE